MTGKTHEAGGVLCSVIGFAILKHQGLLLQDISEPLQWLVMYPFCVWGSVASDLDHNPDSIPRKDLPSKVINKALHLTHPIVKAIEKNTTEAERKNNLVYKVAKFFDAKHRSWQTHSDLTLIILILLLRYIQSGQVSFLTQVDISVASLILMAITMGICAHFILDAITPEGVWFTPFAVINAFSSSIKPNLKILPEKIHFVPHKEFFATGGKWEEFIQKVLKVVTVLAILWFLCSFLYPIVAEYLPYEITFFNEV